MFAAPLILVIFLILFLIFAGLLAAVTTYVMKHRKGKNAPKEEDILDNEIE